MTELRLAAVLLAATALGACQSQQRTPAAPATKPSSPSLAELMRDPNALKPYLEAYPLGQDTSRVDLLAANAQHSMHLVQLRRGLGRHTHPTRTETVYVLTGSGT